MWIFEKKKKVLKCCIWCWLYHQSSITGAGKQREWQCSWGPMSRVRWDRRGHTVETRPTVTASMQIGIAKTPGHGPNGITLSPRLIDVARALSACTALNHVHTRLTRNFVGSVAAWQALPRIFLLSPELDATLLFFILCFYTGPFSSVVCRSSALATLPEFFYASLVLGMWSSVRYRMVRDDLGDGIRVLLTDSCSQMYGAQGFIALELGRQFNFTEMSTNDCLGVRCMRQKDRVGLCECRTCNRCPISFNLRFWRWTEALTSADLRWWTDYPGCIELGCSLCLLVCHSSLPHRQVFGSLWIRVTRLCRFLPFLHLSVLSGWILYVRSSASEMLLRAKVLFCLSENACLFPVQETDWMNLYIHLYLFQCKY